MEVKLPDLGDDAGESAKVTFWYFKEGDTIKEGEDLVEMMTDKATFNVPSPASGTLKEIRMAESADVDVGDILGMIEE
jgi:pyruvate dehydrogenase E2 component (dihydrolipoamide acetyltransferase)